MRRALIKLTIKLKPTLIAQVTEQSIRFWFREPEVYLDSKHQKDILSDPKRVFNGDESGFALCPKTGKVLGPRGYKLIPNKVK